MKYALISLLSAAGVLAVMLWAASSMASIMPL